jgi:spore coat protein U-like protein
MLKCNLKAVTGILMVAGLVSISSVSMAATASSTVSVDATLVPGCEVSPTATIAFANITNLASSGGATATSAGFTVACSNGAAPQISSTSTRLMVNGGSSLPFNLSLTNGAATDDFPTTPAALAITTDGTPKTVPIYARVLAANLGALASGAYTVGLTIDVDY